MLWQTGNKNGLLGKSVLMKIQLPEDVKFIIHKLNEYGYEAYAVGGCVRDSIIRRVPGDWDITTNARPVYVKSIRKKLFAFLKCGMAHFKEAMF